MDVTSHYLFILCILSCRGHKTGFLPVFRIFRLQLIKYFGSFSPFWYSTFHVMCAGITPSDGLLFPSIISVLDDVPWFLVWWMVRCLWASFDSYCCKFPKTELWQGEGKSTLLPAVFGSPLVHLTFLNKCNIHLSCSKLWPSSAIAAMLWYGVCSHPIHILTLVC